MEITFSDAVLKLTKEEDMRLERFLLSRAVRLLANPRDVLKTCGTQSVGSNLSRRTIKSQVQLHILQQLCNLLINKSRNYIILLSV